MSKRGREGRGDINRKVDSSSSSPSASEEDQHAAATTAAVSAAAAATMGDTADQRSKRRRGGGEGSSSQKQRHKRGHSLTKHDADVPPGTERQGERLGNPADRLSGKPVLIALFFALRDSVCSKDGRSNILCRKCSPHYPAI
jgi:hypothetical protein